MTTYRRVEAVRATIRILRYLAAAPGPVTGQEVANSTELPHGTAMCHLATLEDEGLVRSVGGAYELGLGLGLFWAKYKSKTEGKIARLQGELEQLQQ